MTDKLFHMLFGAALSCADREAFVSDWTLSSIWEDGPASDSSPARISQLGEIWDAAHLSIKDIRTHTGLSQAAFAVRMCIPLRTIENWEGGVNACPDYLRLLLAEKVGMYERPTT